MVKKDTGRDLGPTATFTDHTLCGKARSECEVLCLVPVNVWRGLFILCTKVLGGVLDTKGSSEVRCGAVLLTESVQLSYRPP